MNDETKLHAWEFMGVVGKGPDWTNAPRRWRCPKCGYTELGNDRPDYDLKYYVRDDQGVERPMTCDELIVAGVMAT